MLDVLNQLPLNIFADRVTAVFQYLFSTIDFVYASQIVLVTLIEVTLLSYGEIGVDVEEVFRFVLVQSDGGAQLALLK